MKYIKLTTDNSFTGAILATNINLALDNNHGVSPALNQSMYFIAGSEIVIPYADNLFFDKIRIATEWLFNELSQVIPLPLLLSGSSDGINYTLLFSSVDITNHSRQGADIVISSNDMDNFMNWQVLIMNA
ncbi:MAG: hypothetical protein QX189_19855 [Methylococcales bacterium]